MTNAEARFSNSLRPRKPEGSLGRTAQDVYLDSHTAPELCPGASLMNTAIIYASGKPFDPMLGYSYVDDSNLRQPRQIAATMHKMLSVTTMLA